MNAVMEPEVFDADAFLNNPLEGDLAPSEKIPEGDYIGTIDAVDNPRKITPQDTSKKPFASVDIYWVIDDPTLSEKIGRSRLRVKQQLLLNLGPNGLATGKGQNDGLYYLRDALGQNNGGQWSFQSLVGAGPVRIRVHHRPAKKVDGKVYEEVSRVTKM